jgi:hypothetical protein
MRNTEVELLKAELALLQLEKREREELPHKYFEMYLWQHEFIECRHHKQFLTASNQSGKTVSMGLKAHNMSTNKEWMRKQWGDNQPRIGWYILPDQKTINDLFTSKIEPEILARGSEKKSGPHSWKVIKNNQDIIGIYFFETKFTWSFISMGASATNLQSRTVGWIIFDEEPKDLNKMAEIETRTLAFNDPETDLPLSIHIYGFTPTIGHEHFKDIYAFNTPGFFKNVPGDIVKKFFPDGLLVKPQDAKKEKFKESNLVWKKRVNMFDCTRFMSGKKGHLSESSIRGFIALQRTARDVLVKVFGAFEKEDNGGLVYSAFNRNRHVKTFEGRFSEKELRSGFFTAGIDYGSGTNHQSSVAICWISPDYKMVKVYKLWKGQKGVPTTADDVLKKYVELTAGLKITYAFYDWAAADLNTIAQRMGLTVYKAEKNVDTGTNLLNALFNNDMIQVLDRPGDVYPSLLASELENISHDTNKRHRNDDLSDSLRYSLSALAHLFDLTELHPGYKPKIQEIKISTPQEIYDRDFTIKRQEEERDDSYESELDEWAGYLEG